MIVPSHIFEVHVLECGGERESDETALGETLGLGPERRDVVGVHDAQRRDAELAGPPLQRVGGELQGERRKAEMGVRLQHRGREIAERGLRVGRDVPRKQRLHVERNAEQAVRRALVALGRGDGVRDGARVPLRVSLGAERLGRDLVYLVEGQVDSVIHGMSSSSSGLWCVPYTGSPPGAQPGTARTGRTHDSREGRHDRNAGRSADSAGHRRAGRVGLRARPRAESGGGTLRNTYG